MRLIEMAKVTNGKGKGIGVVAVLNGERIEAKSTAHLKLLRRLTNVWERPNGDGMTNDHVYGILCKEAGHYV
jgi:hypothetical protein